MSVAHSPARKQGVDKDIDDLCRTLDNSRKRHLSVGLLRGDQVQDRLKLQEVSASPLLKKARPRALPEEEFTTPEGKEEEDMAMTMAEFRAYMETTTNKNIKELDSKVSGIQETVSKVEKTVNIHSEKIDRHERQIADLKTEIASAKENFPVLPRPDSAWPSSDRTRILTNPTGLLSKENEAAFVLARRSVRLWPVSGSSSADIWRESGIFMGSKLGLEGQLGEEMIESITRAPSASGPGVRDEVVVVFKHPRHRDLVMGSAAKLAPYVDGAGRTTAGIRIEVPPFMQVEFRVLFKFGQNLRAKYGEGTRRHIKFDDVNQCLYLNAKLPGDEQWSKVTLELARKGLRARDVASSGEVERRLDISGPLPARPRSTSVNATTASDASRGGIWTGRRTSSLSS